MLVPPCFRSPLRVEKVTARTWRVLEPLIFESVDLDGLVVLPAGALTNFASTPRFLWWLVPPSGQYDYGAALHDGGYRGTLQTEDGARMRLIRPLCDRLFDEANRAVGVNAAIRWMLYRGVRLFGGSSYTGVPDADND